MIAHFHVAICCNPHYVFLGMNNRSAALQGAMPDLSSGDLLGYHKTF